MRRSWITVGTITAIALLGVVGDAGAQAPAPRDRQTADMPATTSFSPRSGALPATSAPRSAGATVASPGGAGTPPVDARPRTATPLSLHPVLRAKCHRVAAEGRRFRCVVSRVVGSERRVVKRCTIRTSSKRKAARRCLKRARRAAQTTAGGPAAHVTSLQWQGFPGQAMPTVGKIVYVFSDSWSVCSGTVVSRTLVLTAGHCLTGDKPDLGWFAPGATATTTDDFQSIYAPYGWWRFSRSRSWVTPEWAASEDSGRDWGLLEVIPDANGRRIGDVVGSWSFTANIRWGAGANAYLTGYPASGWWSDTTDGLRGRAQYACNSTWDGQWQAVGSGYEIEMSGCPMNGGASGGPWFVRLNSGAWTIGGVNNRCHTEDEFNRPGCKPYGDALLSAYMNEAMLALWNAVVPQLQYE